MCVVYIWWSKAISHVHVLSDYASLNFPTFIILVTIDQRYFMCMFLIFKMSFSIIRIWSLLLSLDRSLAVNRRVKDWYLVYNLVIRDKRFYIYVHTLVLIIWYWKSFAGKKKGQVHCRLVSKMIEQVWFW